jgi:RES domain-containing protein
VSHVIYRVETARFANESRSGIGGFLAGGRWNTPGRHAVYCAGTLALGILEVLAHLTPASRTVKRVYFTISLDELAVEVVPRAAVPVRFCGETDLTLTQKIGDDWLSHSRSVALKVPSAIVPGEFNYILDPKHTDYSEAAKWSEPAPLELDRRIVVGSASKKNRRTRPA